MIRNAIEKTLQKKKEEQQRLKKRFLELPRESKNSSRVFFFFSQRKKRKHIGSFKEYDSDQKSLNGTLDPTNQSWFSIQIANYYQALSNFLGR